MSPLLAHRVTGWRAASFPKPGGDRKRPVRGQNTLLAHLAHAAHRHSGLRGKTNLSRRIKLIWVVQSCQKKYSTFRLPQISGIGPSSCSEGATRDRHGRGAGCGGRGSADNERRLRRTAKTCGPDASTPASSQRKQVSADDGDKKARSPGRARSSLLKPSRAGMPGVSAYPW